MNKNFIKSKFSKRGFSILSVFRKRGKKIKKLETLKSMTPETMEPEESKQNVEKSGGKIYKKILTGMGNLDFSSDNVKKTKRENIKLII